MSMSASSVAVPHTYTRNNMKTIKNILILMAFLPALFACSGTVDAEALPVLTADKTELDIANADKAVLTVTYNGQDVTSSSVIYYAGSTSYTPLEGNVFAPQQEGEYTLYAEYLDKTSAQIKINVKNTEVKTESKFDRHVCVVEFTGAWCINCPEGYSKMMGILSKPTLAKYKENIHICAFHSDVEGKDSLAVAQTQDLFKLFDGLAYPSFATDLRDSGVLTSDGISNFQPSLMTSFNEYPAHCGVAVSSVLNEEGTEAKVTVKLESELTSRYRVVILVVQNNIKGYQKTPEYQDGQDNYNHAHVVRKVVTSYKDTFTGENLTEDGVVESGNVVAKEWTVEIDRKWVLENTEIYAIALDADGYVNNMNVCSISGGDSGFDLKQ
jgi:hypothetical protein